MLLGWLALSTAMAGGGYEAFLQAYGQGDLDAAESLARELLARREAELGPSDPAVAEMMSDLGAVRRAQGAVHEAVRLTSQALDIYAATLGLEHPDTLPVRNNLALLHQQLGHTALALRSLEEVARLRRVDADPADLATSLNNLGTLLQAEGDTDRAERLYAEAVALTPDAVDRAEFQLNLASIYDSEGNDEAAGALGIEALSTLRSHLPPEHPTFAAMAVNVAVTLMSSGSDAERGRARDMLEELDERLADTAHPVRHHVRALLGKVALDQGDPDTAIALLTPSLAALVHQLGADAHLARGSREWLAQALLARGDTSAARALVDELLVERMRDGRAVLAQLSDRASLAWVARDRRWLDLWLQTFAVGEAPAETWTVALAYKGAATRASQDQLTWLQSLHDPAIDERIDALGDARTALAEAAWADAGYARTAALAEQVDALQAELSRLAGDRELAVATPMQLCAALGPQEALVDWLRVADRRAAANNTGARYRVWTLRGGTCTVVEQDMEADSLEAAVASWRRQLGAPHPDPSRLLQRGQAAWQAAWSVLAPGLAGVERLWLVPDGALARVGLAALPDPDGTYLVEQHELRLLGHPVELLQAPATSGGKGSMVVADVTYGDGAQQTTRSCVGGELRPLPATALEARAVRRGLRRAGRGPVRLLTGANATEDAVEQALVGRSWLHLATHGFFGEADCLPARSDGGWTDPMLRSGLVLAPGRAREGVWTAQEVAALDLRALRGVVLSACDTGLGELASGEGVIGLRRAFSLAGVRHQLMSLWAVPDADTAALMSNLYRQLDGAHPATALRRAQLELLATQRGERREDPRSWGAFVAVGR